MLRVLGLSSAAGTGTNWIPKRDEAKRCRTRPRPVQTTVTVLRQEVGGIADDIALLVLLYQLIQARHGQQGDHHLVDQSGLQQRLG